MRVDDALERLEAIHEQLDKGEVYRGFQVGGVAVAGALGFAAAALQDAFVDVAGFAFYWTAVATACGLISTGSALWSLAFRDDAWGRRKTLRILGQFAPCVVAGLAVAVAFSRARLDAFLPGSWALIFGLGLFACRPYLPRAIGWVCLFYLIAGCVLLARAVPESTPSGWQVGGVFGLGLLAAALVLSWNVEREQ